MSYIEYAKKYLKTRQVELSKAKDKASKHLKKAPEGKLRISHNRGSVQYYKITEEGDTHGKYISRSKHATVRALAQKDYEKKLMKAVDCELDVISKLLSSLNVLSVQVGEGELLPGKPEYVFASACEERSRFIEPLLVSDAEYARRWEQMPYIAYDAYPEEKIYQTKKGDMVRSKSEMLLADMLFELGIPYRYEAEVVFRDGNCVHPDFTILKSSTRQIIYYEHMGMMDQEKYRNKNLKKINAYRENGIYVGKNLLLTFETEDIPLNVREIESTMKEMFLVN